MRVFCLFLFTVFLTTGLLAQWNPDPKLGNMVTNKPGVKINQLAVSDSKGGMIFAFVNDWVDYSNNGVTDRTLNVQRISPSGNLMWGTPKNPVRIDSIRMTDPGGDYNYGIEVSMALVPDGDGGVFIAWAHSHYGNLTVPKVQHVDASGNITWDSSGISLASFNASELSICRSGNGVVVGWNGVKSQGASPNMFAQRVNSAGILQWATDGIQLADTAGTRRGVLVSDGNKGAIAFFQDSRNISKGNQNDIYGQCLDSNGVRKWGTAGKPVCARPGDQKLEEFGYFKPEVHNAASDGNGEAVVCFRDSRNGPVQQPWGQITNWDVYAQKMNANGDILWNAAGVQVSTKNDDQFPANIAVDSSGAVTILYISSAAPYLQRLDKVAGERQFGEIGICVAPFLNRLDDLYASMAVADSGTVFVNSAFWDWVAPRNNYLTLQKYSNAGVKMWDSTGVTAVNVSPSRMTNLAVSFAGSVIHSWSVGDNIFAIRIDSSGLPFVDYKSVSNGNWNDPATWSGGVVPNADSKVVINTIVTITADATCYSLEVGPGGQVIVAPGVHFTVLH